MKGLECLVKHPRNLYRLHLRKTTINRQLFHFYPVSPERRLSASPLYENLGLGCLRGPIQESQPALLKGLEKQIISPVDSCGG